MYANEENAKLSIHMADFAQKRLKRFEQCNVFKTLNNAQYNARQLFHPTSQKLLLSVKVLCESNFKLIVKDNPRVFEFISLNVSVYLNKITRALRH